MIAGRANSAAKRADKKHSQKVEKLCKKHSFTQGFDLKIR
jgi:hypothetical protein